MPVQVVAGRRIDTDSSESDSPFSDDSLEPECPPAVPEVEDDRSQHSSRNTFSAAGVPAEDNSVFHPGEYPIYLCACA